MASNSNVRLDRRPCLYGDPRLSNAQVIALRAAAAGDLRRSAQGWFTSSQPHALAAATIHSLARVLALRIVDHSHSKGTAEITGTGEKWLRRIDEAAAEAQP